MTETSIFHLNFLKQARFPFIDEKGIGLFEQKLRQSGSLEEILEHGWNILTIIDQDLAINLKMVLSQAILENPLQNPECIDRSIRFGAAAVHYLFLLQVNATDDQYEMPIFNIDQTDALYFDVKQGSDTIIRDSITSVDPNLTSFLDMLKQIMEEFSQQLNIDAGMFIQTGVCVALSLINSAEVEGMNQTFQIGE